MDPVFALCIWALATMALSPLPIRYQIPPGILLLLMLPGLVIWLGMVHGILPVLVSIAAAVSLFRKPLKALIGRVREAIRKS